MVANLVCTTDSSSAKPRSMTSPAACPTGDCAAAVIATVGTVPREPAEQLHDLGGGTGPGQHQDPVVAPGRRGISEAANASVSPCPACSRAAA